VYITNSLTYCGTEVVKIVKRFIVQAPDVATACIFYVRVSLLVYFAVSKCVEKLKIKNE